VRQVETFGATSPQEAWAAEVAKMINAYKAPVASEDVAPIVEYLAALKGAK
jgi:hypothetical protein